MTISDTNRTNRYTQAALALLSNSSIENAAFVTNITTRTMQRYLNDPEFIAILHDMQQQVISQASVRLSAAAGMAVETLQNIMCDDTAPFGIRSRCADILLQNVLRYAELVTLGNRVKNLEQAKRVSANAKENLN